MSDNESEKRVQVSARVYESTREEWKDWVEESEEHDSVSGMVRAAVEDYQSEDEEDDAGPTDEQFEELLAEVQAVRKEVTENRSKLASLEREDDRQSSSVRGVISGIVSRVTA